MSLSMLPAGSPFPLSFTSPGLSPVREEMGCRSRCCSRPLGCEALTLLAQLCRGPLEDSRGALPCRCRPATAGTCSRARRWARSRGRREPAGACGRGRHTQTWACSRGRRTRTWACSRGRRTRTGPGSGGSGRQIRTGQGWEWSGRQTRKGPGSGGSGRRLGRGRGGGGADTERGQRRGGGGGIRSQGVGGAEGW